MGAVTRDIYSKGRQYDGDYPYEFDGIKALLSDIYHLEERQWFGGDVDATTLIIDLKKALDSDCLTPRMRQVIALYYFAQMTEQEAADVLGINRVPFHITLVNAIERIAVEMMYGYHKTNARKSALISGTDALTTWLNDVALGNAKVYEIPESALDELLLRKKADGDEKAAEALRQRDEGVVYIDDDATGPEYPCLTEEQMRWADRRVSYVPIVYPNNQIIGTRKVAIKLRNGDRYGNEWVLQKRKIFKEFN
ncbi:MAG: hypothetical protein IRZ03_18275 [Acidobacterium ailaaui]|nr:hypothetical protein [Pseudacidobacterium ailaaui]